jgi:RNA polymerase sigma-70 factor (ECF subfamily)
LRFAPCILISGTGFHPPGSLVNPDPTQVLLTASPDRDPGGEGREKLFVLLYDELHAYAARLMRGERQGHTLSPTALVHEAFLRLIDQSRVDWTDRARFGYIAARAMRRILVDHARRRNAEKRGGGATRITLDPAVGAKADTTLDVIAIHDALDALRSVDERAAATAEMRVFAGLTLEEIALVEDVSLRTVSGDWAFARRWLARAMG